MGNQDGLEWVEGTWGKEPRWTKEPDIGIVKKIAQKHLGFDENTPIEITFHAQGAFNKLYKVTTAHRDNYLMRVSLPVDPHDKTASEVATIEFVRKETNTPLPRILAHDANNQNELGFEWILMEMMPGVQLRKAWRKMSWQAKEELIRQLVNYQAQLFDKRFAGIGNIFMKTTDGADNLAGDFELGRIVSLIFFWGDHLTHNASHGPFKSCNDWLQTRLQFVVTDQDRILRTTEDEDEIEDAELAKDLAEKMLQVLPTVFPPDVAESEPSILFHDDLSMQNILVNEDGKLTAIIDWECVSAVPLWRACQLPHLLEGRVRDEKPQKEGYPPDSDTEDQGLESLDRDDLEGTNIVYWEHLLEYEQTQLRKLFLDEMEKLQPEWLIKMRNSTLEADFDRAVHNTGNGWTNKRVKRWLAAYLEGNVESLVEKYFA